jgi:hypothetical protein
MCGASSCIFGLSLPIISTDNANRLSHRGSKTKHNGNWKLYNTFTLSSNTAAVAIEAIATPAVGARVPFES